MSNKEDERVREELYELARSSGLDEDTAAYWVENKLNGKLDSNIMVGNILMPIEEYDHLIGDV